MTVSTEMARSRKSERGLLIALLFLSGGCNADYVIRLPNGYFLARVTSREKLIADPGGKAVLGPNVETYAVKGDVVVGSVGLSGTPSWFVLNTKEGTVSTLDHAHWRRELHRLGIDESDVIAPTRWHAMRQR